MKQLTNFEQQEKIRLEARIESESQHMYHQSHSPIEDRKLRTMVYHDANLYVELTGEKFRRTF